jgi:LysM repeat protein
MLKIRGFVTTLFLIITVTLQAQSVLVVHGNAPRLHLSHTVVAKETWYSIGRLYNIAPKDVASFNGTAIDKPLSIGQSLKIPLAAANFSQNGTKAADEVLVPLYHTVQEKEWMYRISQHYNKVPVETLEKWNNIKNDQLKPGMNLVVGYLKVKPGQSALAASGTKKPVPVTTTTPPQTVAKAEPPVVKTEQPADIKKEPEVKKEPVTPAVTPTATPKEEPAQPVVQQPKPAETTTTATVAYNGAPGGYFKSSFSDKGRNSTGNAGIFRSTSGWKDGKYYALMNNVPVGTIIKITFPSTSKSVYAKVLGQMPEMRESVGLTLRISDAAASELGAEIGKFYVDVKY